MLLDVGALQPGMVLAEDLNTPTGRTVLKKGTVLTEVYIQKLKTMKVGMVTIAGEEAPAENISDEDIKDKVEAKFAHHAPSETVDKFKQLARQHIAEMILKGEYGS